MDDEEYEGGMLLFPMGSLVVVTTQEFGRMAGSFIGLTEFGIAFKLTHKEGEVTRELSTEQIEYIREELKTMTVEELKGLARSGDISTSGRKAELVDRLTTEMVRDTEENLSTNGTIELAVPTTTLLSWSEIAMIQDGQDFLNDQEVVEFRKTIVDGLDTSQIEAPVSPESEDTPGE